MMKVEMQPMTKVSSKRGRGRPHGSKGPSTKERLRRAIKSRRKDLELALLNKALEGDVDAIKACFEILGEIPAGLKKREPS